MRREGCCVLRSDVTEFRGAFRFLSNFYPSEVLCDGLKFRTVEHAYQAAKFRDWDQKLKIRKARFPSEAKRLGKALGIREDWDEVKVGVMEELLRQKFAPGRPLHVLLVATRPRTLIEGNNWGDKFWGGV